MPAERTVMRQVREVLRLTTAGVGLNEIARRVGVAPSTVRLTLKRLANAGVSWPLPAEMSDSALETTLFAAAGTKQGHRRHAEPDWAEIHRELKRKHVTLTMLWDEYIERCPEGYRYSRFCELYRGWASRLSVTMRQAHIGGDKLFVDYAGDTVPVIVDRLTGRVRPAQIFVAAMGASNFTYAEATWTQALADWIGAHTRAFAALGGVPKLLVPDNTKVAVIKACLYEPQVNRTYAEMAAHYDTAILPARPRRPRDKAKVSRAPASQATSSRIAGRHHLGISGRLRRNLQTGSSNWRVVPPHSGIRCADEHSSLVVSAHGGAGRSAPNRRTRAGPSAHPWAI
jgi:transposase